MKNNIARREITFSFNFELNELPARILNNALDLLSQKKDILRSSFGHFAHII